MPHDKLGRNRLAAAARLLVLSTLVGALLGTTYTPGIDAPSRALAAPGDAIAWTIGGPGQDEARSVAVDGGGNVYLAGVFSGTIDVDPGPATVGLTSTGEGDAFLAKYDPDGRVVWARSVGGPSQEYVHQVAVDPFGNVWIAGSFSGLADFAPGEDTALVQAGSQRDGFIAKYDLDGALLWVSPLNLAGDDEVLALAVDGAGNAVAAGLAAVTPVPAGQRGDAFVMRLAGDGRALWSLVLPTQSEGAGPVGVGLGAAGEVYLATSYTGALRVAVSGMPVDHTSLGGSDVLLLKLMSSGLLGWSRSFGGPQHDAPGTGGLALDRDGTVLVTGTFDGRLDLAGDGTTVLEGQGQGDLFLVSYATDGTLRWGTSFGGTGRDGGQRVAVDAAGYVYVAGWFSETARAPLAQAGPSGRELTARGRGGATDILLAKYGPDGRLAWTRGFGSAASGPGQASLGNAVAVDPRGDVLLAGRLVGSDVDVDPDTGTAILRGTGQADGFVAQYGPDGALRRR